MKPKKKAQIPLRDSRKITDALRELTEQTDRGLAVVGAAIIQEKLKDLIIRSFVKRNKKIRNLFGPDGALGAFAAQIKLAYAVGLIGSDIYSDLNLIREIRNKSAHFLHYSHKKGPYQLVTFKHETLKQWALSLKCPSACGISNPRKRFETTCFSLINILQNSTWSRPLPLEYEVLKGATFDLDDVELPS